GMDVKALRTQPAALATKHLRNSIEMFLCLVEKVRSPDRARIDELRASRASEELDWLITPTRRGWQESCSTDGTDEHRLFASVPSVSSVDSHRLNRYVAA